MAAALSIPPYLGHSGMQAYLILVKATHLFCHHIVADGAIKEHADRVPAVLGSHQGRTQQYHMCTSLFSNDRYILHALPITTCC